MNTPTLPFEQDPPADAMLAGEYVLGVLDAAERRQVEQRIAQEPAFAQDVAQWEARLMPLVEQIAPVAVPDYVWARIVDALGIKPAPRSTPATEERGAGFWESLGFWRWLSVGGFAAAAVCGLALLNAVRTPDVPVPPPVVVQPVPTPPVATPPAAPTEMASTLTQDDGKPGYVATLDAATRRITVTPLQPGVDDGKVPELWLIPQDGKARSLGVFDEKHTHSSKIPEEFVELLGTEAILAMTLEPPGGAPGGVATGPVVAKGGIQLLAMSPP